jgi:hypothetical protein
MKHVPPPAGEPVELAPDSAVTAPPSMSSTLQELRSSAANAAQALTDFLDRLDADVDLEPHLGFPELLPALLSESHSGTTDDREDDADLESTERDDDEEGHDAEPSLGSSNDYGSAFSCSKRLKLSAVNRNR